MPHEARFQYGGPYRAAEHANDELESMFARGDVRERERPMVESRKVRRDGKPATRWFITLAAD